MEESIGDLKIETGRHRMTPGNIWMMGNIVIISIIRVIYEVYTISASEKAIRVVVFPLKTNTRGYPVRVIFLVIIFAAFYFLTIRPQRKKQKQHEELVQELRKGDRVITAGGIYGQIESMNEESIVLKIEGGGTIRIARPSVIGKRDK